MSENTASRVPTDSPPDLLMSTRDHLERLLAAPVTYMALEIFVPVDKFEKLRRAYPSLTTIDGASLQLTMGDYTLTLHVDEDYHEPAEPTAEAPAQ